MQRSAKKFTKIYNARAQLLFAYACINVKLEGGGGGGPRADVGHLTSIAFPTLGNLTKNLGPRVGTFAFLHRGMRPSHVVPRALISVS